MDGQQKILVVDDERFNVNVLVDLLKQDYKMMVAKNGEQALKACQSNNRPDMILLDVMMPEMDGYEVCRCLKADQSTCDIPVIFVSAMAAETDETKGLELGAVDYITKPISPSIVKARVKTHLALKSNMEELQKAYKIIEGQKERMQTELNVGRDIQMSMLPLLFPILPEHKEFEIAACLKPAREVGGDFYDFFFIDDDCFCICIADVSGKGVPAALLMAVSKTLIKSRATDDLSPASILTHVNDEISLNNPSCMFVTTFLGILNIKTGEFSYTNAGHNPPFIKRRDGALECLSQRHGPVIGAIDGMTYKEDTTVLSGDDILFLYTDGVTESMDLDANLFGEERLVELLSHRQYESTQEVVSATVEEVKRFEGEANQADDITVLAIQFFGSSKSTTSQILKIRIKNRLTELDIVQNRFNDFAEQYGIPKTIRQKMNVAFDELLNNTISYAYTDNDEHDIDIRLELFDDRFSVTITDDGMPFNPFVSEPPDTELSLEDRQIGGLGIHLVRNMLDNISYHRRIDKNVVTLFKNLNADHTS